MRYTWDWQAKHCIAIFDRAEILAELDDTNADVKRDPDTMEKQAQVMVDALNAAPGYKIP